MSTAGRRRRGPRTDGADTRTLIVAAARAEFAERGLDGASLRGIARRASVDPALVHHYFEGKEQLFVATIGISERVPDLLAGVRRAGPGEAPEALVLALLRLWGELATVEQLRAVVSALATSAAVRGIFRQMVADRVLLPLAHELGVDEPERRVSLLVAQLVGLGLVRYVVELEPLASASRERVVSDVAPVVRHYLYGPLSPPGATAVPGVDEADGIAEVDGATDVG